MLQPSGPERGTRKKIDVALSKARGCMRMRHDPQERDPRDRHFIEVAASEAERELREEGVEDRQLGYCHLVWSRQQRILEEKYGIIWRSPAEMDPNIVFD